MNKKVDVDAVELVAVDTLKNHIMEVNLDVDMVNPINEEELTKDVRFIIIN
jgi:hypothetical protein